MSSPHLDLVFLGVGVAPAILGVASQVMPAGVCPPGAPSSRCRISVLQKGKPREQSSAKVVLYDLKCDVDQTTILKTPQQATGTELLQKHTAGSSQTKPNKRTETCHSYAKK